MQPSVRSLFLVHQLCEFWQRNELPLEAAERPALESS
jgi:hypothetical protein